MTEDITVPRLIRHAVAEGCSPAFASVLAVEAQNGDTHHVRNVVRRSIRHGTGLPAAGGHFVANLWAGDVRGAWRSADARNRRIMRSAGLGEGIPA